MNDGRPPTRPLQAHLPFDDPVRDDRWFEEAVRDLLGRLGYENVEYYGESSGNPQEGIDLRADRDRKHYGIQAKKRKSFGEAAVESTVADATYGADRFILALSRRATVGARKAIQRHKDKWELWDQVRLSDLVRDLPLDAAVDYVERHFHPAYVEVFLGHGRATTFIQREVYFERFSDPEQLIVHNWARVGPTEPLDSLRVFLSMEHERLALVHGPIGIGKTKALYDLTSDTDSLGGRSAYFLSPAANITAESLREIRAGASLVIVDDANELETLPTLLGHILQRPDCKIIVAVAAASFSEMRDSAVALGFEPAQLRDVQIDRLGRDATIALVQQVLGRTDHRVEQAVVLHASDSPLTTILTTRLIRERQTNADSLQSEEHVRELVRALYRDIAVGDVSAELPRADVKAVLQVLAATGPAKLEEDIWLQRAAAFLSWDVDRLLHTLDVVDDSGVLLRRGFHYGIAPEILRQSLVLDACVARGRATQFAVSLGEQFSLDVRLLRNIAVADLESQRNGGPNLFDAVWCAAAAVVRESHSLDRSAFLEDLDEVAYYKPGEVFELVRYVVDHPATNDETQPYAEIFTARHDSVLRCVPKVLKAVMLSSPSHVRACVETLWRLGKNDEMRFIDDDPLGTVAELARYEIGFGTGVAEQIVEAVAYEIAAGERDTARHSLLELIAPVLSRDITAFVTHGAQFTIQRSVLNVESVQALRDRAISVISDAALGTNNRRADFAIKELAGLLREPMNQASAPATETIAAWDRERAMAFDAFDRIVASGEYPLRELRIHSLVLWYALNSPSELVRSRSAALLQRLTPTHDRDRYRALVPEFVRADTFVDLRTGDDWQRGEDLAGEFLAGTTRALIAQFSDPVPVLADLESRLMLVDDAGIGGTPHYVFESMVAVDPAFAERVFLAIIDRDAARFYRFVGPFVHSALMTNRATAETLVARLLESNNVDAAIGVASGLSHRVPGATELAALKSRFLVELLQHNAIQVRLAAARALMFFTRDYPETSAELVGAADVGDESQLADDLFMALPTDLATLEPLTVERLAQKLREVKRLEYWPLDFLRRIARTRPDVVIGLFTWRITSGPLNRGYHAVPYEDVTLPKVFEELVQSPGFADGFRALLERHHGLPAGRRHALQVLFRYVARVAPAFAKAEIEIALNSTDPAQQRAGLELIQYLPHAVVTEDLAFVIRIVERAVGLGDESRDSAFARILNALQFGAESVGMYEPAPSELRIQAVASEALTAALTPPARRFFEMLREHGERSARQTIRHGEDLLGPQ